MGKESDARLAKAPHGQFQQPRCGSDGKGRSCAGRMDVDVSLFREVACRSFVLCDRMAASFRIMLDAGTPTTMPDPNDTQAMAKLMIEMGERVQMADFKKVCLATGVRLGLADAARDLR